MKALTHQRQPSRNSCGPASIAILVDTSVEEILARLPSVRVSAHRQRLKGHWTNIGEARRLLASFNLTLSARRPGRPQCRQDLLRIDKRVGRNWHFAAFVEGMVYDPAFDAPMSLTRRLLGVHPGRVSHYEVRN